MTLMSEDNYTEYFTDETLTINDTYGDDVREIVVLVMEVDKVANEVNVMEVDKVTNMMAKITNEDSSDMKWFFL